MLRTSQYANISLQIIYNLPILKSYIERRIQAYDNEDPYKCIELLKAYMKELKQDLEKMRIRDIHEELLKKEIRDLKSELGLKDKECTRLQSRQAPSREVEKKMGTVTPINPGN
ncbi:MAG: hypothetical protein H6Q68_569 [Firmicutes bacterium]|nr:hypothetical protein [Bacillota bacterium]